MTKPKNKPYKCPVCGASSCGDDYHTITGYIAPERALGDRMKVCLLQIYDCLTYDNLQKAEIKALLINLVDEHIVEKDEATGEIS